MLAGTLFPQPGVLLMTCRAPRWPATPYRFITRSGRAMFIARPISGHGLERRETQSRNPIDASFSPHPLGSVRVRLNPIGAEVASSREESGPPAHSAAHRIFPSANRFITRG